MNSIPFLGIPVLNRGDLLTRCVESIDYPVDNLVIVRNGRAADVDAALERLRGRLVGTATHFTVLRPGHNLGVAASWNLMCSLFPDSAYHLLVGNDIQFLPGALQKFDAFTRLHTETHAMVRCFQGYGVIALTQRGIRNVGGFDESIYPAYFEDNDHHRRLRLLGELDTDVSIPLIHGEHGHGSCTVRSSPDLAMRNGAAFGGNQSYYIRKWGGPPHGETFTHPFNDPNRPLNGWTLDQEHYDRNFKIINQ